MVPWVLVAMDGRRAGLATRRRGYAKPASLGCAKAFGRLFLARSRTRLPVNAPQRLKGPASSRALWSDPPDLGGHPLLDRRRYAGGQIRDELPPIKFR